MSNESEMELYGAPQHQTDVPSFNRYGAPQHESESVDTERLAYEDARSAAAERAWASKTTSGGREPFEAEYGGAGAD